MSERNMSIHPTWRADDIVMPPEADGDPPDMIEEIHWLRQEVATTRNLLDTEKEVSEMRGRQSNEWHDKWEFEHALADDLQKEVERLDTEVIWLQDYGRIPQLEALLREAVGWLTFQGGQRAKLELAARIDAFLGSFSSLARQPSYVPPPVDPLLAKPEKHR
jgi:hypothetical protein